MAQNIITKDGTKITGIPDDVDKFGPEVRAYYNYIKENLTPGAEYQFGSQTQLTEGETAQVPVSREDQIEQQAAAEEAAQPETTYGGALGGALRGAGPTALAAAIGAPVVAAERITAGITPLIADFINETFDLKGTPYEQMSSQEMYEFIADKLRIPKPDTKAEQLSQGIATGIADAAGMLAGGQMMSAPAGVPSQATLATRVGGQLSTQPLTQLAGAGASVPGAMAGGSVGRRIARALGAGERGQQIGEVAGQFIGGGAADLAVSGMVAPFERRLRARGVPMSTKSAEGIRVGEEFLGADEPPLMRQELAREAFPSQAEATGAMRRATTPGGAGEMMYKRYQGDQGRLQDVMNDYGIEVADLGATPRFAEELMDDFLTERQAKLNENVQIKREVIQEMPKGPVNVESAQTYLDEQFARLGERDTTSSRRLQQKVQEWKQAIDNKNIEQLEATRKDLFDELKLDENIPTEATQILKEAYEYVVDDMGDFIMDQGDQIAYNKWKVANRNLAEMSNEFGDKALRGLLEEGQKNPENMRYEDIERIFFSHRESDARKIYDRLSPEGQGVLQMATVGKLFENMDPNDLSPRQFRQNLQKYSTELGVVMDQDALDRFEGLRKLFTMTAPAEDLVRAGRGAQLRTGDMPGMGALASTAARKTGGLSILATRLGEDTLGKLAQKAERPAVRNLMASLAEAESIPAQTRLAKRLLREIGAMDALAQFEQTEAPVYNEQVLER